MALAARLLARCRCFECPRTVNKSSRLFFPRRNSAKGDVRILTRYILQYRCTDVPMYRPSTSLRSALSNSPGCGKKLAIYGHGWFNGLVW